MASYNKKQDFEQWLSEHDPDSKKYKYRDKSAYSYIREQKETASIPRTREVERAYAENPAGWENSKNMQAASVVPRAGDYRAGAGAYSARSRQQKPTATSRNPRSSYYSPNWQKEINEREAQKRQAAQVAADNRAAEHAARIQQRSNAITSIMQRYASAPDFESGIEKGKALYSNTQGQSGEKTPSFMEIYSGALNPGSISPKAARGLVKQGERQQLDAMSEDEKNIYYYLLGTKGDAAANEFKSLLDDELNRRIGTAQAEQAEILGTAGVLPFVAGVESSYAGAAQALLAALGSEKTVPRSPYQYAYQAWRERIAQQENNKIGLRGIANDLGYTVGNMLPGMELSAAMGGLGAPSKLASALGSGSIGLSSGGNAYREGRDMGYSHNEAITYGALTGASEAGLQYLLGGVSKLGAGVMSGKVGNVVSKALDKVVKNKAVADTVARYVADMGSEATEEYLQSVLEPVFRNIAAGENNDIDLLSDEALYSAMMGALTAGLFNAPEMASGINNARSTAVAEHLEPSNAQLKYFTPEEASDPRKSRSRMEAYAKEFGDVLNNTSPDPARMREMQDIVSEYNTLRAMNRADAIEQAATQAAARASQAQPPENIRQAASQAAENAAQSVQEQSPVDIQREAAQGVAGNEVEPSAAANRTPANENINRVAEAAAKAAQTQPPTNVQETAAQAAEKAAQSTIKPETKNNTTPTAKEPTTGVATNETAAQPEANQETDKAKTAATALDNITKAGAMNTPYEAVTDAYKEMVSTGVITLRELSDAYATGLAEYNKSHADTTGDNEYATKIANALSTLNKYVDNDIKYTIRGNDNWGYTAAVTRIRDNNGGVPIENARDTLFIMSGLKTRQDAVDALVGVSHNLSPIGTTQETVSPTETPKVERKPPNDAMIQKLEEAGFKRWTKGAHDRLYINATSLGLEYETYKSGSIRSATFNGEEISNSRAGRMLAMKMYIDVTTGELHTTNGKGVQVDADLAAAAEALYNSIIQGEEGSQALKGNDVDAIMTSEEQGAIRQHKSGSASDENISAGRKEPVDSSANSKNPQVRAVQEVEGRKRAEQAGVRGVPERDTQSGIQGGIGSLQGELPGRQGDAGNTERRIEKQATVTNPQDALATAIADKLIKKGTAFNSSLLFELADKAYGGTMADGTYTVKDAYDAMELAVNKTLLSVAKNFNGDVNTAVRAVNKLQSILDKLPTQTKRTEEQTSFQQFSTPPNIAFLAAWAANINDSDVVLEPSAGIGGLAVFPKAWGADVVVNELSERRLAFLKNMGFDRVFNENAEQINNVLPDDVKPSIVIMNPPFSSTAGRTATNKTSNAIRHVEQALQRLEDGGRLVAILGRGMANDTASFKSWWDSLRQEYDVRANISIDGSNYKKYGTSFDVQLVIIDKTGPQKGETLTGTYKNLTEIPAVLEGIRNDRIAVAGSLESGNGRGIVGLHESESDNGRNRGIRPVHDGKPANTELSSMADRTGDTVSSVTGQRAGVQKDNSRSIQPSTGSIDGRGIRNSTSGISVGMHDGTKGDGERPNTVGHERTPANGVKRKKTKSDNGVYADYEPAKLPIKGAKPHPTKLVESSAMASVPAPVATYTPNLPQELITSGALSSAQLENIVYAGQAHQQTLPDGSRKGYFIGDGTGVGKGREIAGIILDNFRQGRNKAVWVSVNPNMVIDATRDWTGLGQNKDDIMSLSKVKLGKPIAADSGILFASYNTLASSEGEMSRLQQIVDWLGRDFDGVIAFDEAHKMNNLMGKQGARGKTAGSQMAKAGVELQRMLPNARVVYVSATGATDVSGLAFAERLGLWGRGTAFNDAKDFVSKIGSSGIAAMELVSRDMKASGVYLARSISYDGVTYDTLQHTLTPTQTKIYNTMSKAWQITLQNVQAALKETGASEAKGIAKSSAISQ